MNKHLPYVPKPSPEGPSQTQLRIMELEEYLCWLEPQVIRIIASLPDDQRKIVEKFFSANTERELHIMRQAYHAGQKDEARKQCASITPLYL